MTKSQPHLFHPTYRPDIDGLRALAVASIVGFHAFPDAVKAGFIGVDIFFVISGFLISTIIFRSFDDGTFSFSEFYARRIRRIFPALFIVLASSFAFGWLSLFPNEYKQLGKHIAGGAGFISNIVLWNEAGYFDNAADTKPLLHLWSLGIEEQFYIVWPLLVWFIRLRKFNPLTIISFVIVISFILNIIGVKHDSVATYYSPQTRFWELLSGSLLAWIATYKRTHCSVARNAIDRCLNRIVYHEKKEADGRTFRDVTSLAGAFLLLCCFWEINKDFSFPGKWAAVVVLGTALIISAGSEAWINRTVLSHRVMVWLGLISFPLYLWHWPMLSFARIIESEVPGVDIRIYALAISIALALATYVFIERPIRRSDFAKTKVTALVILMVITGGAGFTCYLQDGLPYRKVLSTVVPPITWLGDDDPAAHSACMEMYGLSDTDIRFCRVSSDKKPHIAVIGDSHAAALYSGLAKELKDVDGEGLLLMGGRLFVDIAMYREGNKHDIDAYKGGIKATRFVANETSIDTVVLVTRGPTYFERSIHRSPGNRSPYFFLLNNPSITDKKSVFETGLRTVFDLFVKNKKRIIFVLELPTLDFPPEVCQKARPLVFARKAHDCLVPREQFDIENNEYRELIFSILKDYPSISLFDPSAYLCDDRYCRAVINGVIIYCDTHHLSKEGSEYIGKELIKVINGANPLLLETR